MTSTTLKEKLTELSSELLLDPYRPDRIEYAAGLLRMASRQVALIESLQSVAELLEAELQENDLTTPPAQRERFKLVSNKLKKISCQIDLIDYVDEVYELHGGIRPEGRTW